MITYDQKRISPSPRYRHYVAMIGCLALADAGCNSILNGWLDPTILGRFDRDASMDLRTTLSLDELPSGVAGESLPTAEDRKPVIEEYPIAAGDVLNIEIYELRDRLAPFQIQAQVSATGSVNLPVVGRVSAVNLTVPEFEQALIQALRERDILQDPQVTVNGQVLQRGTFSIFGIGVSASNDSPLRAGTFPIRRPDLRVLEAINQVGGLNEFVTDVYIFRSTLALRDLHAAAQVPETRQSEAQSPTPQSNEEPKPNLTDSGKEGDTASAAREIEEAMQPRPLAGPAERSDRSRTDDEPLRPSPSPPFLWVDNEWVPNLAERGQLAKELDSSVLGVAWDAGAPAVNWSRIAGDATLRVIRIPADALRSGDANFNIYIRAGDVLRISSGEIGVYYVMGQVTRVGPFRFEAERVTLKSAIATAGGLSGLAWPDRCTIYRRQGLREQMVQVNLDRIFAGQDPDVEIKRGDIINVGTHPFAPFLQRIRAWTLPNPVNNVGYSFTYSRNFADIDSFSVQQNPRNEPDRFPALFP